MCVCVCLLNVGVFTREDRHTDDMKNKQAGIAHEELKTDRKAWIFGGGSTIYIYMNMEGPVLALLRITNQHQHALLLSYSRGSPPAVALANLFLAIFASPGSAREFFSGNFCLV